MLWIALFTPELPLQAVHRGLLKDLPLAVSDGPETRPIVLNANPAAHAYGIRNTMNIAAARALCGELIVLPREPRREHDVLTRLATLACQFTPTVTLDTQCVLMEVARTLKLHKGLGALLRRLRKEIDALGFNVVIGLAPTPLAAWLIAKARVSDPLLPSCRELEELPERLHDLSLTLFDWPRDTLEALASLGIATIADMQRLPRAGVTRRFGDALLSDLDRALGKSPDPRTDYVPAQRFSSRIDFLTDVEQHEALLVPLRQLLAELEHFLRARGAGVDVFTLVFEHGSHAQTPLDIVTHDLARDRDFWERLTREKLDRTIFPAGVSALTLQVARWSPFAPTNGSFLPDRMSQARDFTRLKQTLAARLDETRVFTIRVQDDHRPELAWSPSAPMLSQREATTPMPLSPRPLWALDTPRALTSQSGVVQYHGDLTLLTGPERIETGWWDSRLVARDYFVARNPQGETVWIFRSLFEVDKWYLHGLFA